MFRLPRSTILNRWFCRRLGHKWGEWEMGWRSRLRDCSVCATREVRYGKQTWFVRRTMILGRVVKCDA